MFKDVFLSHHTFCPGIDGPYEVFPKIGVYLVSQIESGGALFHKIRIGQYPTVVVGELTLILYRENNYQIEKIESRFLYGLLDTGSPPFLQVLPYGHQSLLLLFPAHHDR